MKKPKYQYHVQTWGGFYNDVYQKIHKQVEGDFLFDTKEERTEFINNLRAIEEDMDARVLMTNETEGYNCNVRTIAHRITKNEEGEEVYTTRDLGVNYSFINALYMMKEKWFPGFNDYPFGLDYDYSKVEVVSEWVTGAMNSNEVDLNFE